MLGRPFAWKDWPVPTPNFCCRKGLMPGKGVVGGMKAFPGFIWLLAMLVVAGCLGGGGDKVVSPEQVIEMPAWTPGTSWRFEYETQVPTPSNNWTVLNPDLNISGVRAAIVVESDGGAFSYGWDRVMPNVYAFRLRDGAVGQVSLANEYHCRSMRLSTDCEQLVVRGGFVASFARLPFPWMTGTTNTTADSGYEKTITIDGNTPVHLRDFGDTTTIHLTIKRTPYSPDVFHAGGFEHLWYSPDVGMVVRHYAGGDTAPSAPCLPSPLVDCGPAIIVTRFSKGAAAAESEATIAHHLLPPDFVVSDSTEPRERSTPCPPPQDPPQWGDRALIFPEFVSNFAPLAVKAHPAFAGDAVKAYRWTLVDWTGKQVSETEVPLLNESLAIPGTYFLRLEGFDARGCLTSIDALSFGVGVASATDVACSPVVVAGQESCPALTFGVNPGIRDIMGNGNPYAGGTATPSPLPGALVLLDAAGQEVARSTVADSAGIYHVANSAIVTQGFGTWRLQFLPDVGVATEMEYGISSLTAPQAVHWPTFPDGWLITGTSKSV